MCTFYILVRYTSNLIMCTVGSICIIFDFTNKTFILIYVYIVTLTVMNVVIIFYITSNAILNNDGY